MKIIHFEISMNDLKLSEFHLIKIRELTRILSNFDSRIFMENENLGLFCKASSEKANTENVNSTSHSSNSNEGSNNNTNENDMQRHENKELLQTDLSNLCDCKEICSFMLSVTKVQATCYLFIQFYNNLQKCPKFCRYVLNKFFENSKFTKRNQHKYRFIGINLSILGYNVIDYNWNERLLMMSLQRKELDRTMSWLSTIGGAYSSLGDENEYFANMAARTSVEQHRLALKLGDESMIAKCKLFYALSLIQKGCFLPAYQIIKQQHKLANNKASKDVRLNKMSLGIWAKLKYEYRKNNVKNKSIVK